MSKHPFSNKLECHKADVQATSISVDHPDGWRWGKPCLCPAFQRLRHTITEGVEGGAVVRRQVEVTGCLFTLYAWMQGGATVQANAVLADVGALRQDVQESIAATHETTLLARNAVGLLGFFVTAPPVLEARPCPELDVTSRSPTDLALPGKTDQC
jgi:hypothetical protein